jgi:hypothetical protein
MIGSIIANFMQKQKHLYNLLCLPPHALRKCRIFRNILCAFFPCGAWPLCTYVKNIVAAFVYRKYSVMMEASLAGRFFCHAKPPPIIYMSARLEGKLRIIVRQHSVVICHHIGSIPR